jgi:hypothetical protein
MTEASSEATLTTQDPPPPATQETKDEPPKRMISLKHVKSTEPAEHERKRVFLPETDSKQDFPISTTQQLSTEQLNNALNYQWQNEKLNSPSRMRDAGLLPQYINYIFLKYTISFIGLTNLIVGWCEAQLIDKLWAQKSRMDTLFDDGEGFIYRQVKLSSTRLS